MEYPIELLLSDEYVEFSKKVADLHNKKKLLKDEFKAKLEELQKVLKDACKAVDDEAKVLLSEWENWVKQKLDPRLSHEELRKKSEKAGAK